MKYAAFSCSRELHEPALDFYRSVLRKTALRYPDLTLRVKKGPQKHTTEMIEFAQLLGLRIDTWDSGQSLLRGYEFDPEKCGKQHRDPVTDWPEPIRLEDPADLVLIFQGRSEGDVARLLTAVALKGGARYPLHIYEERWSRKRGTTPQTFQNIVHRARHKRLTFQIDPAESVVWVPETERQAA